MSTSGIIGEEIDKHAALAGAALRSIARVGEDASGRQSLPRTVLEMLGPIQRHFILPNAWWNLKGSIRNWFGGSIQNCFRWSAGPTT